MASAEPDATLLDDLVDRLGEVRLGELPAGIGELAKIAVLHALGCAYEGRDVGWSRVATSLADELGGAGDTLVWLLGERRQLLAAVYANSAASQAALVEDVHAETATHPGTVVVPAALAIGEHVDADGSELLEAVIAGYEAIAQVGRLAVGGELHKRGFRPNSVFGPLGAAAAAGRLLGLGSDGLKDALALAVNGSGGLTEWSIAGTMEAGFQTALAAQNGVQAALLAWKGSHGARTILDGRAGLLHAFSGWTPPTAGAWPIRDGWEIEHVYAKPYPSCVFTQEAIEATRRLVRDHGVRAADVADVRVRSYALVKEYPGCDNPGPYVGPGVCIVSTQFAVAAVLLDGDFLAGRYDDYNDPELTAIAARISVEVDPEAERVYPASKVATVEVRLRDGRVCGERVVDLPYPDRAEIEARFRRNAGAILGPGQAECVIELVAGLDRIDRTSRLLEALEGDPAA
jgi:2-methylcitrate dehydratase PrpD